MTDDHVSACVNALKSATTDFERLKALQSVTCSFKTDDAWHETTLCRVFDAIDFDFLVRILRSSDDGSRALALALLGAFSTVPELLDHNSLLEQLPFVVDNVLASDVDADAAAFYVCALSLTSKGQEVLVESGCLMQLCKVFAAGEDQSESVYGAIVNVVGGVGARCWSRCPSEAFHILMNALADKFVTAEKSQAKFDSCEAINAVVWSMPLPVTMDCRSEPWYSLFNDELMGALCFKLGEPQREPLLRLCAAFVEKLGASWALGNTERSYRLYLLLVQLSCVEMRMALEDQSFEHVMSKSELLSACFAIVENSIYFLISDGCHVVTLDARQQLYETMTSAFGAVLQYLSASADRLLETARGRHFLLATVRVVGAWLAEETAALREEVHAVLPLLLRICRRMDDVTKVNDRKTTECFIYFLLPGLCHLSVEDGPRAVMLAEGLPAMITEYVATLWPTALEDVGGDEHETTREEIGVTLCCGILMNIVVLEGGSVGRRDHAFLPFLRFVFAALPTVDKRPHQLVLRGNLAVLGLLLLRRYAFKFAANESAIYRFLSASIRFLWDAFGIDDEFSGGSRLELARAYRDVWDDLKELWFLGMQALSSLLPTIPWIGLFIVESGWTETVVTALAKVQPQGVEYGVCREYEGFLVCLTKSCDRARVVLLELGATRMCHTHGMTDLDLVLRGTTV